MIIGLATDSAADLPQGAAADYGIEVVPLEVHLGDEVFRDGIDLDARQFFARVEAEKLTPRTSHPPVGAFIEAYRRLLTRCQSVISVHLSSTLSGTFDAANVARKALPEADITVIDSRSVSLGLGLQVLQAARAIQAGMEKSRIIQMLEKSRNTAELYVALDTLDFLHRGGRIGKAEQLLGSLLQIKPLLVVADGLIQPFGKARSREQAVNGLLSRLKPLAEGGLSMLGVAHTVAVKEAEELRRRLQQLYGRMEVVLSHAGPVLGTHAGPGALGIAAVPA